MNSKSLKWDNAAMYQILTNWLKYSENYCLSSKSQVATKSCVRVQEGAG